MTDAREFNRIIDSFHRIIQILCKVHDGGFKARTYGKILLMQIKTMPRQSIKITCYK